MVHLLVGHLQRYDWGDPTFIPGYLGLPADGHPWAEMWWGTHPLGPAHIDTGDGPLLESVTGPMSMLVKLLACDAPLSLQTHPTPGQAREGFAREERAGIPRDDPTRMYKDDSDKPEMLVALTRFEALCGFRRPEDSAAQLRHMGWTEAASVLESHGIGFYLRWAFAQESPADVTLAPEWLRRIAHGHPDDSGLWVAPLLHHVVLQPGDALSLPAGNLHAYLRGAGLEVMKSSDNVVRAGFTSKHVDVDELLRIVDVSVLDDPVTRPTVQGARALYTSPTPSFAVSRIDWRPGDRMEAEPTHRIVVGDLGLDGSGRGALLVPADEGFDFGGSSAPTGSGTVWVCTQFGD